MRFAFQFYTYTLARARHPGYFCVSAKYQFMDKLIINSWTLERGGSLETNDSGGGSALPYKVYSAWFSQMGTDNPVVQVLQNTLGADIVWTRLGEGDYEGTLQNGVLFTGGKTTLFPLGNWQDGLANSAVPLHDGTALVGYYTSYHYGDRSKLGILVYNAAGEFTDLSTIMTTQSNATTQLFIEIRIYP